MKYTIYLRRNLVNGKCYVGQTSNFRRREYDWKCLKYRYANKFLTADRAEFGLENFEVKVLAETDSREEAWELEQHFIKELNTLWPNGYNLDSGGERGKRSEETKQKMSEAKKGIIPKCVTPKPVYQYTKDKVLVKVWPSTAECGRNGYNQGCVSKCCNNCYLREGNNIYKNHIWSYTEL